jgi:transposase-like protein
VTRITIDSDQLRSDVQSGRTLTSIASDLGVSHSTVSRAAKAAGIVVPKRPPPITRRRPHRELDDPDWLAASYAARQATDIADELGVSPSTVYVALHRHGIPVRDPGDSRRRRRPAPLNDADWLRARYERTTTTKIAEELGVNPQMVLAAMRHHGIELRDHSAMQRFRSPAALDDGEWLRRRFSDVSPPVIADELGVARRTVYLALERHGIDAARSPWLNRGHVRLTPPDETKLRRIWETEETISGVARQLDVSVNTAAVWLADIGVFVKEAPVISQRDLLDAIDKHQSIKDICRQHHVTARTVAVELRRHGLLEAHKKRHLR